MKILKHGQYLFVKVSVSIIKEFYDKISSNVGAKVTTMRAVITSYLDSL